MRAIFHTIVILFLCALGCGTASADTTITLFKTFAGNVNFVGTQKTMLNKKSDKKDCPVTPAGTELSASLSGIPDKATIVSAHLYWAGSSSIADTKVMMDGAEVTADAARRYTSGTISPNLNFFGGAADVTVQVTAKRNHTYRFSGLTINNGSPYCEADSVLGGFALLVVYADAAEPYRVLNLYEGFQIIHNSNVTLTVSNFRTPNPVGTGKIGHLAWEGAEDNSSKGEDLLFNNVEMVDKVNKKDNQFNAASNINDDDASYGIDFDAYTVGSNTLAPGQTSATALYRTGKDMVLLNAGIFALPSVRPIADLEIAMTRNSALVPGQNATYTLTVGNRGPQPETGPVVVTATLPVGLGYVAAAGAGWSCGAAGKVVTCSRAGSMAVGAVVQAITLTVLVEATSDTLTNTASVSGQVFDNNTANNVATDTAEVSAQAAYVFTDSACVHGQAFGTDAQPCKKLSGLPLFAGVATPIFVTALNGGVPTRLSGAVDTTVAMRFALRCIKPVTNAGMQARYANLVLPLCTADDAVLEHWSSSVGMLFAKGAPSAAAGPGFSYADVGKVQLFLRDATDRTVDAVPFVVKPYRLAIIAVTANGFDNPKTETGNGYGFMKAGEAFTVTAAAYASGSNEPAPNFGSEGATLTLDWRRGGDTFVQSAMVYLPDVIGKFAKVEGGVFLGTEFSFGEAGVLTLSPKLDDYLGAGMPKEIDTTTVGRFYPDHFKTETTANMACLPHMGCPAGAGGATYSNQAFPVKIIARNAANAELRNYNGVLARDITLAAYDLAGGDTQNPSSGVLSANVIAGSKIQPDVPIGATPVYTLPKPFINSAPRVLNWTVPTPIFLRASSQENIAGGTAEVTSKRGSSSVEGGVTVVSGRLSLNNPHGSELLKMPVRADAQYWSAAKRWETSATDNISPLQSGGISFDKCLKGLKGLDAPCKAAVLGVIPASALLLKNGMTTFWLKAPGVSNDGSAEFQMNNPPWLPSTIGRAVFGVYKSPFIYRRELY